MGPLAETEKRAHVCPLHHRKRTLKYPEVAEPESYCDLGRVQRSYAGGVRNTGVLMSGHWRFCVTAFLTLTGLSTLPASSNPLTDLFDFAPKEAATPAPPQEECLLQPGKSTAPRQHWLYRRQGHQKCWFQADEETVSVKKHIHHRVIKERSIAQEENEAALRNKTVLDARAQLLNASAGAPQSAVSAPGVVDTVPVATREAAVPAAPTATGPRLDALTPENDPPRSVDVEGFLAASTLDKE
jgi:hypothetical protein